MDEMTHLLGEKLLGAFLASGFVRAEPAMLQSAQIFLEMSGEEMRNKLLLVSNPAVSNLCLRPDYTLPVCLEYVGARLRAAGHAQGQAPADACEKICYLGPVFQMREAGQPHCFLECGLEDIGRGDRAQADADAVHLAVGALAALSARTLHIRYGDVGLLNAVVAALEFPPVHRRFIARAIKHNRDFDGMLEGQRPGGQPPYLGVLAALDGQSGKDAKKLMEDLLAIAGIVAVGGRTVGEIAERFLEKAALEAGADALADKQNWLARFLALTHSGDGTAAKLLAFAKEANIASKLEEPLDLFAAREVALHAAFARQPSKTAPVSFGFEARFVRNFDYYSGLVFEAVPADDLDGRAVAGGGRYDELLHKVSQGAFSAPAVGAAVFLDGLAGAFRK